MNIVQKLANLVAQRRNLLASNANNPSASNNNYYTQCEIELETITQQYLPHGSGFDSGTKIDTDKSQSNKLVFSTSFHHMDENGFYDGWTEHTITVRPDFVFNLDIKISGSNRNDIKDYIHECFYHSLTQEYTK